MDYQRSGTLKIGIILTLMVITLVLPLVLTAQTTQTSIDVGCGPIVVYPSDSSGNFQNAFNVGQSIYVTLRLQSQSASSCSVNVDVTGKTPSGVTQTLYSGSLNLINYQSSVVPLINPISSATPTGTWTIIVTLTNPTTGQTQSASFDVNISAVAPSPTPAPPSPISPLLIAIIVAVVIIIAAIGAVMYLRRPGAQRQAAPAQPPPQATAPPPPRPSVTGPTVVSERKEATKVGVVLYRLRLPSGSEIPVTEAVRVFGRETFERYGAPPEALQMISREERGGHFRIFLRGNKWYVEDLNSTNGTLLNGKEIKGKGPQELKSGDTISPAGVLDIKFIAEESTQVYSGSG